MTKTQVLKALRELKNDRGVTHWEKLPAESRGGLKSHGVGLTQLRKLAKKVGRDRKLAAELWKSDLYEARVIALLVDEPKALTREQVETQVEDLAAGMLRHVFASCDATLAKAPIAREVAFEWIDSDDDNRRACGFALVAELAKKSTKGSPTDEEYSEVLQAIDRTMDDEPVGVQMAMGNALINIGKRSAALNKAALKTAKRVGPIRFDDKCDPFDAAKHLTSPHLQKKLK